MDTRSDKNMVFLQDNTSAHTELLDFYWKPDYPVNSPDLNPVENAWGVLTERIYRGKRCQNNLKKPASAIHKEFSKCSQDHLKVLADSMIDRLRDVVQFKGGHPAKP